MEAGSKASHNSAHPICGNDQVDELERTFARSATGATVAVGGLLRMRGRVAATGVGEAAVRDVGSIKRWGSVRPASGWGRLPSRWPVELERRGREVVIGGLLRARGRLRQRLVGRLPSTMTVRSRDGGVCVSALGGAAVHAAGEVRGEWAGG